MKDVFVQSTTTRLLHLKNHCQKKICLNTQQKYPSLGTEMYILCKGISPKIVTEFFALSLPLNYNIRHQSDSSARTIKSVYCGKESLAFFGPKNWEPVPPQLKNMESLQAFKSDIKMQEQRNALADSVRHMVQESTLPYYFQ